MISGGAGDDIIYGDGVALFGQTTVVEGDDYLDGGAGNDQLVGGGGNDTLNDTAANDDTAMREAA